MCSLSDAFCPLCALRKAGVINQAGCTCIFFFLQLIQDHLHTKQSFNSLRYRTKDGPRGDRSHLKPTVWLSMTHRGSRLGWVGLTKSPSCNCRGCSQCACLPSQTCGGHCRHMLYQTAEQDKDEREREREREFEGEDIKACQKKVGIVGRLWVKGRHCRTSSGLWQGVFRYEIQSYQQGPAVAVSPNCRQL